LGDINNDVDAADDSGDGVENPETLFVLASASTDSRTLIWH
jgi:hypothetical protein